MAKKKHYEYRDNKQYNRDSEGLKQRRLKEESRWKYNPNESYDEDLDDTTIYEDDEDFR